MWVGEVVREGVVREGVLSGEATAQVGRVWRRGRRERGQVVRWG